MPIPFILGGIALAAGAYGVKKGYDAKCDFDDAKDYKGILPIESFAIGGTDSKSYVRREIVYVVTLKDIKGF